MYDETAHNPWKRDRWCCYATPETYCYCIGATHQHSLVQHVASHLYYCFHVVSLKSLIHVKLSNECSMKNCCSAFTSHDENLNLAIFQDSNQIVISSRSLYTETWNLSFGWDEMLLLFKVRTKTILSSTEIMGFCLIDIIWTRWDSVQLRGPFDMKIKNIPIKCIQTFKNWLDKPANRLENLLKSTWFRIFPAFFGQSNVREVQTLSTTT